MDEIEARLARVLREVFSLAPSERPETLRYKEHARWDSLGHIELVLAVEREFGLKLSSADVVAATGFAELAALLRRKREGA